MERIDSNAQRAGKSTHHAHAAQIGVQREHDPKDVPMSSLMYVTVSRLGRAAVHPSLADAADACVEDRTSFCMFYVDARDWQTGKNDTATLTDELQRRYADLFTEAVAARWFPEPHPLIADWAKGFIERAAETVKKNRDDIAKDPSSDQDGGDQ